MKILKFIYILLLTWLMVVNSSFSQSLKVDTLDSGNYSLRIGNIGFATDSMDIFVGDVPLGEISYFMIEVCNFGKEPVTFTNGKSNRFVTLNFTPNILMPFKHGTMNIEFDVDAGLSLGEFDSEISIISDDNENPYKFLNLRMNIVESTSANKNQELYDTIPHMVFDHYNYDYGHLVRGKNLYHTFVISNTGSEPLYIIEIIPPKGIKIIDVPIQPILPGKKTILRIIINTHGRVGVQHQSVKVRSNDPSSPIVILGIHGSVRVFPEHKKTSVQCGE